MMSKQIKLTVEQFEYNFTLQDDALHIEAKHIEDCLVWETIINDALEEPIKKEIKQPQKQFVINLDPAELFELFDFYGKDTLDKNIKITFPQKYKTENEHLCIVIDFQMSFGKPRSDTKYIRLNAVHIPKDTIMFQKLANLKTKTNTETEAIVNRVGDLQNELLALRGEILALRADMLSLNCKFDALPAQ